MDINKEEFAKRIKALRESADLTQDEMATILGTKRGTIAAWEAGHRIPELSKVYKVAEYFKVSTDYILGRTDDPRPPQEKTDPSTPAWCYRDTPPTRMELEEFLKKANVYFDGTPLDEEDKEDILDYLAWKWEREKKKREKESKDNKK